MHSKSTPFRLRILVLTTVIAALALPPANAHATVSSDAVAALNQVRAQVGVDPIANDETLAGDCGLHASWMRRNSSIAHFAAPGTPGYTVNGADAGMRSVLHDAFEFTPQTTPKTIHWLVGAPLHLYQLLHPGLIRSGYAYDGTYACMWTLDPKERPSIDVFDGSRGRDEFYTWPPSGAVGFPLSEDTSGETPSPNVELGLPREQVTGPYMLVFASGFGNPGTCGAIRILSASIVGSDGVPVAVRWWDDAKTIEKYRLPANSCPVPAGGGYVVAERPLTPGVTYTTTIELVGARVPLVTDTQRRSFTFRTSNGDTQKPSVRVRAARATRTRSGHAWLLEADVSDASRTTCTATVNRARVRCSVRNGRIRIVGRRSGSPRAVAFALVVRDASKNERRVRVTRIVR